MSLKICVYAICKNESKFVEKWLENMSEADQIVVLDTGSTDGTYELLKNDPRVTLVKQEIITPWRFDVARNKSLELVPDDADILVCTDFDELFEPGWADHLRNNWILGTHNRCHYKYAWCHGELGEPQFIFTYDKIHSRGLKWIFPVHEVLWPENEEEYEDVRLDMTETIFLHHWQDLNKPRGNYLDLLHLACEEFPDNSHIWGLLGREYMLNENYEKAIDVFLETLEKPDIETCDLGKNLLQTLHFLAECYYKLEDYEECVWYSEEFIRVNYTYREPYFTMARALINQKLPHLAVSIIETGIKYATRKNDWVEGQASWSFESNLILGAAYMNMGKWSEAQKELKAALEFVPNNTEVLKQYIECLEHQLSI